MNWAKYMKSVWCVVGAIALLLSLGAGWYGVDSIYARNKVVEDQFRQVNIKILNMEQLQSRSFLMSQYESIQKQIYNIENYYRDKGGIPPFERNRLNDLKIQLKRIEVELTK